ncbi:Asp-tRNA(Asn)/Glu-tRNA(Gln) amidotransferase subunit GatC [Lentisphaerota bacterium WC36G]|nr:Asp-tRNA(Asn)/Glu-tRNA(Gln) amidotransferase subunit GatC [Lentisphaerae bacterium WC36]
MSNTSQIDVGYVAKLARLELDDASKDKLQHDLEEILAYIEELGELDVDGIEPTAHALPIYNVMREDVSKPSFEREVMLKNAPGTVDDELLKVPQVLPGEGMS